MTSRILTQITELGADADLLTRHDDWLETQREDIQGDLERKTTELRAILLAQRIKRALQQRNLVPVQQLIRSSEGGITDMVIHIMNLPDAIQVLREPIDTLDEINAAGQLYGWGRDGYDIKTSNALRPSA
jgi:hypothetical protein